MVFIKRKKGNRRFERERVLDVKLRTRPARNARLRLAGTALAIAVGTVTGLYTLWRGGEWALDRFIFQNDAFAVVEMDIQTDGWLSRDQIRRWTGVKPGDNLFNIDLARIHRDLELVPVIRSASVERILPHTLRVRVAERAPVAQVKVPEFDTTGRVRLATYYLDETGFVMRQVDVDSVMGSIGKANADLPKLTGLNGIEIIACRSNTVPRMLAAVHLLSEFDESPMAGLVDLESIDLSNGDQLVALTGQGSHIIFGCDRIDEQFRRWHLVYDLGHGVGRAILSLDLSVSNNAPVLWLEANAVPASAPKAKPPPRPRRKNV